MAIEKRFIHFKKFSDFNSKKLSANEANTQYTVGIGGEIQTGSPDVLYQSYVWIKDTQQQWTHGQIYNGNNIDVSKYLTIESVDSELDSSSINPIQNQAVASELSQFGEAMGMMYTMIGGIEEKADKGATALQPHITSFSMADISAYINYNVGFNVDAASLINAINNKHLILIPFEPDGLPGYCVASGFVDDFIYLDVYHNSSIYHLTLGTSDGEIQNIVEQHIQEQIHDLDSIREGASKGATAVQQAAFNSALNGKVGKTDTISANLIKDLDITTTGIAKSLPVLGSKIKNLNANLFAGLNAEEFYIEKNSGNGTWTIVDHNTPAIRGMFTDNGFNNGFSLSPDEEWPVGSQFRITIYPKSARNAWIDFFAFTMYCNARHFNISAEYCARNDGGTLTWQPVDAQVSINSNEVVILSYKNFFGFQGYNRWGIRFTFEITRAYASTSKVVGISAYGNRIVEINATVDNAIWTIGKDYLPDVDKNVTFPEKVIARSFEDRDGNSVVMSTDLATVATSGNYADLTNKPTIPAAVTESTVSGWGFTKNTGTITGVSANGTSVATSGVANIPAATTSKYGVTKLSSSTSSTSTTEAATPSAVKAAYDLANSYKGTVTGVKINGTTKNPSSGIVDLGTIITAHQTLKTINGESIIGSGDIEISGGGDYLPSTGGTVDGDLIVIGAIASPTLIQASGGVNGYLRSGDAFLGIRKNIVWGNDGSDPEEYYITAEGDGTKFLSDDGTYKTISGAGSSVANIQAVDTQETLDDVETNTYVKYVAQTLTEEQKAQVRENIGCGKKLVDGYDVGETNLVLKPNEIIVFKTNLESNLNIIGFEYTTYTDEFGDVYPTLYDEYSIIFRTGFADQLATPSISLPDYVKWANGTIPNIEGEFVVYELSIARKRFGTEEGDYSAVLVPFKSV